MVDFNRERDEKEYRIKAQQAEIEDNKKDISEYREEINDLKFEVQNLKSDKQGSKDSSSLGLSRNSKFNKSIGKGMEDIKKTFKKLKINLNFKKATLPEINAKF